MQTTVRKCWGQKTAMLVVEDATGNQADQFGALALFLSDNPDTHVEAVNLVYMGDSPDYLAVLVTDPPSIYTR